MRRLIPRLRYTHPSLLLAAGSLFAAHFLFGIDALMGVERHSVLSWRTQLDLAGGQFWIWAIPHFAIALLGVIGLYGRYALCRIAYVGSLLMCNFVGLGFLAAFLTTSSISLYASVATLTLSVLSIACLREREVNPAMMDPRLSDIHS